MPDIQPHKYFINNVLVLWSGKNKKENRLKNYDYCLSETD